MRSANDGGLVAHVISQGYSAALHPLDPVVLFENKPISSNAAANLMKPQLAGEMIAAVQQRRRLLERQYHEMSIAKRTVFAFVLRSDRFSFGSCTFKPTYPIGLEAGRVVGMMNVKVGTETLSLYSGEDRVELPMLILRIIMGLESAGSWADEAVRDRRRR